MLTIYFFFPLQYIIAAFTKFSFASFTPFLPSFFFVGEVNFTCVQARVFPRVEAGDGSQGNGVCMLFKYVRTLPLRGSSFNKPMIK